MTWPAGQYTLAINATGASGQTVTVTTQTQGTVSGINLSQSPPQLTVNGQSYPITAIQSIKAAVSPLSTASTARSATSTPASVI